MEVVQCYSKRKCHRSHPKSNLSKSFTTICTPPQTKASNRKESGYWEIAENRRNFMDQLSKQLGFKDMTDWYDMTAKKIIEHGGAGILGKYGDSPFKLITSVYTDHSWNDSNFNVRKSFEFKLKPRDWDNLEKRIELVKYLAHEFHIKELNDWYRISMEQIGTKTSTRIFRKYNLEKLLKETYPDFNWDIQKLKHRTSIRASQRWLKVLVQRIFPNSGIFLIFKLKTLRFV
jgi:hypothetical protein